MNNTKVAYFFGAGAEAKFNLPLGSLYTYETMLHKKSDMMRALKEFYPKNDKYSYTQEFMFHNGSHTLFEEFCSSMQKNINLFDELPTIKNAVKNLDGIDEEKVNAAKNILKEELYGHGNVYETAISDKTKLIHPYLMVINSLSYFGAIEKDFACIIDPEREGKHRFWRLINYFWSAFFTILLALLDSNNLYIENEEYKREKYKYVLNNLDSVLNDVYQNGFYDYRNYNCRQTGINYYQVLSERLQPKYILTTNYTPIVQKYFVNTDCIYLAGELKMFEEINTMSVKRYNDLIDRAWIFPFLHTQAPVKPIICQYQIEQYAKMVKTLKEIETLVVIGYSFGEYDSHINSMIRDYVEENGKKLVSYEYVGEEMNSSDVDKFIVEKKETIEKALRVSNKENIQIIPLPKTTDDFIYSIESDLLGE